MEPEEQVRGRQRRGRPQPSSELLWNVLTGDYSTLGFDTAGNETFKTLLCARLAEPTGKIDTIRVLEDIGAEAAESQYHQRESGPLRGTRQSS